VDEEKTGKMVSEREIDDMRGLKIEICRFSHDLNFSKVRE